MKTTIIILQLLILSSCQSNKQKELYGYPNCFASAYCVDTISIIDPVIISHNNDYFVCGRKQISSIKLDSLTIKNGFIPLFWSGAGAWCSDELFEARGQMLVHDTFPIDHMAFIDLLFEPSDSINGSATYRLRYTPTKFILLLCAQNYTVTMEWDDLINAYSNDQIKNIVFADDYGFRTMPIFSKGDTKKINENIYQYIYKKKPDWLFHMPSWLFNLLGKAGVINTFML